MRRNTVRSLVDVLMYGVFCFMVGTGLLIHYRLVPGNRGGHGLSFLGMTRHEWGSVHLFASFMLIALIVVHVVVNITFVKNWIALKKGWLMAALGLVGVAIIGFFLAVPITRGDSDRGANNEHAARRRSMEIDH